MSADLGVLRNQAVTVGIAADVYPFPQVAARLERAEGWERVAWEAGAAAAQEVEAARARVLAGEAVNAEALAAYMDVVERNRRWWDELPADVEAGLPGRDAPAVLAARKLAEAERWQAGQLLNGATTALYAMFAARAAKAVDQVAGVLSLPARVWSAVDPVDVLPADTLATLQEAERTFQVCHFAGLYLRSMGPDPADQFRGDEPHMACTFRRWAEAHAHHHELRTVKKPLKLVYAVKNNWQPGLWTADDLAGVDQGPARRRFVPAFKV